MTHPLLTLNDGRVMPQLGFGTWRISNDEAAAAVREAIRAGYALIDTAAVYGNERGVGEALAGAGETWVTTKVWNDAHGRRRTRAALAASLERLGREHVELYLIHWPVPSSDLYLETWEALIELREEGRARSIGVSNFDAAQIERLERETGVLPAVNQIELHPRFQQRELSAFHRDKGIATQSWSPLGKGGLLDDPTIGAVAERRGASPAQVVIAWHLQKGFSVIPKASDPNHMRDNFGALGVELEKEDMEALAALDDPRGRTGPDPADFELDAV
ncbi:MAG: aldo/keto reductase [Sphingomonadaceae bacterium]